MLEVIVLLSVKFSNLSFSYCLILHIPKPHSPYIYVSFSILQRPTPHALFAHLPCPIPMSDYPFIFMQMFNTDFSYYLGKQNAYINLFHCKFKIWFGLDLIHCKWTTLLFGRVKNVIIAKYQFKLIQINT